MTSVSRPKVLILMPFCNESAFLDRTLKSILAQDFRNWVLVAQDNFSEDNSLEIFRNYQRIDSRLQLIPLRKRIPVAENWNSLIQTASVIYSPSYISWIGGDDYWQEESYLGALVEKLEMNPMVSACVPRFKAANLEGVASKDFFDLDLENNSRIRNVTNLASNWANALAIYGLYKADLFYRLSIKSNTKISDYDGSDWCWTLGFLARERFVVCEKATYVKIFKQRSIRVTRISRALVHLTKVFSTRSPKELLVAILSTVILALSFLKHKIKS